MSTPEEMIERLEAVLIAWDSTSDHDVAVYCSEAYQQAKSDLLEVYYELKTDLNKKNNQLTTIVDALTLIIDEGKTTDSALPIINDICAVYTELEKTIKEKDEEIKGIIPDKVQPCGCQLCFCEGERCNGCGAKLCSDSNCDVRKGILTYKQHPYIAQLQAELSGWKEKLVEYMTGLEVPNIIDFLNKADAQDFKTLGQLQTAISKSLIKQKDEKISVLTDSINRMLDSNRERDEWLYDKDQQIAQLQAEVEQLKLEIGCKQKRPITDATQPW